MKLTEVTALNTGWLVITDDEAVYHILAVFISKNSTELQDVLNKIDNINAPRTNVYDYYEDKTLNGYHVLLITKPGSDLPSGIWIWAPTQKSALALYDKLVSRENGDEAEDVEAVEIEPDDVNITEVALKKLLAQRMSA